MKKLTTHQKRLLKKYDKTLSKSAVPRDLFEKAKKELDYFLSFSYLGKSNHGK